MAVGGLRRLTVYRMAILSLTLSQALLGAAEPEGSATKAAAVEQLLTRDLAGDSQREALMITVTYRPGGASLPHRHDAQVFVYVLDGEITMQLDGSAPVKLRPGETFYEGPNDIHRICANASETAPAKILVFMIKDKGKAASRIISEKMPQ